MSYAMLINSMGIHDDLRIDVGEFIKHFSGYWPNAQIKSATYHTHVLQWEIKVGGILILGGLQSDYQTLAIEGGDYSTIGEIAAWYRSIVPPQYRLFIYSGATYHTPIELLEGISAREIEDAFIHIAFREKITHLSKLPPDKVISSIIGDTEPLLASAKELAERIVNHPHARSFNLDRDRKLSDAMLLVLKILATLRFNLDTYSEYLRTLDPNKPHNVED